MKILLLGSNGQLGWELVRTCPTGIDLVTCDYPKVDFLLPESIQECIINASPDWIINAAGYTAVDQAETEPDKAYRINHEAVLEIALLAKLNNIRLAHISTDYVFNGRNHKPWQPSDATGPQSVYGMSKLKGEQAVRQEIEDTALIIRTAWLYSSHGNNFVKTMLDLMRKGKDLKVIDEQVGTPTWAKGLAQVIFTAMERKLVGTFHWTDAGVASWYDFAVAIQEEAFGQKFFDKKVTISPVSSDQFPAQAKRPNYSVLDKQLIWRALKVTPIHWREQLRCMLGEI